MDAASFSASPSNPAIGFALELFRDPLTLRDRLQAMVELPSGMTDLLHIAGAEPASLEEVAAESGVTPKDLRDAARFFVQQVMLMPDADYYRMLGVGADEEISAIKKHHRLLMRVLHPDRHAGRECWTDSYAARVNRAYNALRNPQARKDYDRSLRDGARSEQVIEAGRPVYPMPDIRSWEEVPTEGEIAAASDLRSKLPGFVLIGTVAAALIFVGSVYLSNRRVNVDSLPSSMPLTVGEVGDGQFSGDDLPTGQLPESSGNGISGAGSQDVGEPGAALSTALDVESWEPSESMQAVKAQSQVRAKRGVGDQDPPPPARPLLAPPADHFKVPKPRSPQKETASSYFSKTEVVEKRRDTNMAQSIRPPRPVNRSARQSTAKPVAAAGKLSPSTKKTTVKSVDGDLVVPSASSSAVVTVISKSSVVKFSDQALMAFLGRFVDSYQRGDLSAFMSMFSSSARTSDEANPEEIRDEYRKLFRKTDAREMSVSKLRWRHQGATALGEGHVVVSVWRDGGVERFSGGFRIEVSRRQQQLVILGLYYKLERS